MTIKNSGVADRKLIKANSPVAKSVELHNNINDNGVMKMRQVQEIVVKWPMLRPSLRQAVTTSC